MGLVRSSFVAVLAVLATTPGLTQGVVPVVTPTGSGMVSGHVPIATNSHTVTDIGAVPAHSYLGNNTGSASESSFLQPTASDITSGYQLVASTASISCATRQVGIGSFSGTITLTLPNPASTCMQQGQTLAITDSTGSTSATNNVQLTTADGSTINGVVTSTPIATTIPTLQSPGSVMLAVWDGVSNWHVSVLKQPERTYDLARDFGAVPASIINSSQCFVSGTALECNGASFTQADNNDVFVAEGLDVGNVPFVGSIASVTDANRATLASAPYYDNPAGTPLQIIDGVTVDETNADGISSGSNYAFSGPTECLTGGMFHTQVCGLQMALGAIVSASAHTQSGIFTGSCTGELAQTIGSPLGQNTSAPDIAVFNITVVSGTVTSVTPTSVAGEGLYKGFAGYSYGATGYVNVPVTLAGCGSGTALFIDVKFGVVTENFLLAPNAYTQLPPDPDNSQPCDKNDAAATYTTPVTGFGLGLRLYCSSHTPWSSAYQDASVPMQQAISFESTQNDAHEPVCVTVRGRFGVTPYSWPSHIVNGAPCFIGDAQNESGFFKTPKAGMGAIIPFVGANDNGGAGPNGLQLSDPNHGSLAGPWLQNLTFWGLWADPSDSYAVINFGDTEWGTYENISCFGWKGALFGTGVDTASTKGDVRESFFENIRTNHCGDAANGFPAWDFSSMGVGNGNNNDLIVRYRAFQNWGIPLRMSPCASGGPIKHITILAPKIEETGVEGYFNATNGMDIGDTPGVVGTPGGCANLVFQKQDGTTFRPTSAYGVSGIQLYSPNFGNLAVGTVGLHIKGGQPGDVIMVAIDNLTVNSTSINHGAGIEWDASGTGNKLDVDEISTADTDFILTSTPNTGQIVPGSLEVDCHDICTLLTAAIDGGANPMSPLRCVVLGQTAPYVCDGTNGAMVDLNSTQTLTNKTIDGSSNTLNGPVRLKASTVSAAGTCNSANKGLNYEFTDLSSVPLYNGHLPSGGGLLDAIGHCNGSNWVTP